MNKIVSFNNVSYQTPTGDCYLDNISFDLNVGETIIFSCEDSLPSCELILRLTAKYIKPLTGEIIFWPVPNVNRHMVYYKNFEEIFKRNFKLKDIIKAITRTNESELNKTDHSGMFKKLSDMNALSKTIRKLSEVLLLKDCLNKAVNEFTYDERILTNVLLLLIFKPHIILLDNLLLSNGNTLPLNILQYVREYCRENGITMLMCSNHPQVVEGLAHRNIVITNGVISSVKTIYNPFSLQLFNQNNEQPTPEAPANVQNTNGVGEMSNQQFYPNYGTNIEKYYDPTQAFNNMTAPLQDPSHEFQASYNIQNNNYQPNNSFENQQKQNNNNNNSNNNFQDAQQYFQSQNNHPQQFANNYANEQSNNQAYPPRFTMDLGTKISNGEKYDPIVFGRPNQSQPRITNPYDAYNQQQPQQLQQPQQPQFRQAVAQQQNPQVKTLNNGNFAWHFTVELDANNQPIINVSRETNNNFPQQTNQFRLQLPQPKPVAMPTPKIAVSEDLKQGIGQIYNIRNELEKQIKATSFSNLSIELQNKILDNFKRANSLIHDNDPQGMFNPLAPRLSQNDNSVTQMLMQEDLNARHYNPTANIANDVYNNNSVNAREVSNNIEYITSRLDVLENQEPTYVKPNTITKANLPLPKPVTVKLKTIGIKRRDKLNNIEKMYLAAKRQQISLGKQSDSNNTKTIKKNK